MSLATTLLCIARPEAFYTQTARMVLPLAKLGTPVLRILSKPVANRLKQHASHHPRFRGIIIRFAQIAENMQYNHATNVEIRPLNEERPVKAASDFIGEASVFGVAGAGVTYEVSRSAKSEARNDQARNQVLEDFRTRHENFQAALDALQARVDELEEELERARVARVAGVHISTGKRTKSYKLDQRSRSCTSRAILLNPNKWPK